MPDSAPTFTDEWTGPTYLRRLSHLARSVRHLTGCAVEIGVWEGRSLLTIAEAVAPAMTYGIDHWRGSAYDGTDQAASKRDVEAVARANVAASGLTNVTLAKMGWREFFDAYTWSTEAKLVHLDGSHSYEETEGAVRAALDIVVPGGIMCGDDWTHPEVEAAVSVVLAEREDGMFAATGQMWWWQRSP